MVTCCAFGCTNRSCPSKPGVTFHRFPTNHLRIQWINAVKRKNWKPNAHTRICSDHFKESDFDRSLTRVRLRDHAVPSVFKTFPKYMQKKESCRKPSRYLTARNAVSEGSSSSQQNLQSQIDEPHDEPHEPEESLSSPALNVSEEPTQSASTEESIVVKEIPCASNLSSSPSKLYYKWKVKALEEELKRVKRKIKTEKQKTRRQKKKIADLSTILSTLQKKQLMSEDDLALLAQNSAPFAELLSRMLAKQRVSQAKIKYPKKLRLFALNLHYYSPRAYKYVRNTFLSCLPHHKTISKWYASVNCEPGFTKEALQCLEAKSKDMPAPVCNLTLDEMAIRKHPCFDGKTCHGYVNFGGQHDDSQLAKEALVFMVVSMNYKWKIPVGYFLLDGISSSQKANLTIQCIRLLHDAGIKIVSVTFDGLSANFSMAKHLGCDFSNLDNLTITFPHPVTNEKIAVFLDPCHMLKLVRNCLGEKKKIFDYENKAIQWKYIAQLFDEQTREGLHLANKIKSNHIFFFKQKMKVSLATQTLSDSVADAISFCDKKLKLNEFTGSEATVKFIRFFNKLFDLFNSQSMDQLPHKRPVHKSNLNETVEFLKEADMYINGLRIQNNSLVSESILLSNRKTGFLGFKISVLSLLHLIKTLLRTEVMEYIPTYRLSQDHLELFFSAVRFMGGANNNPTARQFKAAYRKLLIHSEIHECTTGNCMPLEQIPILTCTSAQNATRVNSFSNQQVNTGNIITEFPDHDYVTQNLSEFVKECIKYIAGSIVRRISKSLNCEICLQALYGEADPTSLTSFKSKGRLLHSSEDVFKICNSCELIFRFTNSTTNNMQDKLDVVKFTDAALNSLSESQVFETLENHISDTSPLSSHRMYLIKEIAYCFYQARIGHFSKRQIDLPSVRSICTKIPLFKGQ